MNVVLINVIIELICIFIEKCFCLCNIVNIFVKIGDIVINNEVFVVEVYFIDSINIVWYIVVLMILIVINCN